METKLKSVLRDQRFLLAFKALLFGVLLLAVRAGGFGAVPLFFFFSVAGYLYIQPLFRTLTLIWQCAVFLTVSVLFFMVVPQGYALLAAAGLAALFYLLLGMKHLVFVDRKSVYLLFSLFVLYIGLLTLFYTGNEVFFLGKLIGIFTAMVIMLKPLFRGPIVPWVLAFLAAQVIWAIALLPIGFLQSANLSFLVLFIGVSVLLKQGAGTLTKKAFLGDIALLIAFSLFVFATSRWGI